MRLYYLKYSLLFLLLIVLSSFVSFFIIDKNDNELTSLLILNQAIEDPIEINDINRVNSVIDIYTDKIIIEKNGAIYTSNFGKKQQDRINVAQSQLENSNNLWKPLITPNKDNPAILYYKSQEINYFNKILLSVIIALSISLCALPLIIFMFRDFYSLSDSIDNLQHYLDSTKEKLENIKDTQTVHNFDNTKEADKLYKKLTESKNKRIIFKDFNVTKNTF